MLLSTATKVYSGASTAKAVYLGDTLVWPKGFTPNSLTGLSMWLDAADYTPGSWLNRGSGAQPGFIGSPSPVVSVNRLNGLPVVRFAKNEGRLRMLSGSGVGAEWTLVYVGRMVGPFAGRIVTAVYQPANLLVGFWNGLQDVMYDNGFTIPGHDTAWTTDWKTYSGDGTGTTGRLFSDGLLLGTTATAQGWKDTFSISGYDPTLRYDEEACDCEVAEVVLYNRKLSDAERQQVEGYLHDKWFKPPYDPDTNAYLVATGLDVSYAPALDGLVKGLKDVGLWTKMSAIYPFIGGTEALHKWNLKDPRDTDDAYRLTFRAGTHSPELGYQPNPVAIDANGQGRADTHFVPRGLLDQNSTHLSLYSLQDKPVYQRCDMGAYNWDGAFSRFHVIAHYLGERFYYGMAESGASSAPSPASTGLFVATRTGANEQSAYRNGVSVGTSSQPSVSLPNIALHIGEISGYDREYSDLPVGFASIGAGLPAQDNIDLNLIVTDYQTALGRRPAFTGFW